MLFGGDGTQIERI